MSPAAVVITGLGVMSPLGNSVEQMWQQLLSGQTAGRAWDDLSEYRCARACRIEGPALDFRPPPLRRGRALAIAAAQQALQMAGALAGEGDVSVLGTHRQVGVFVGSTLGESAAFELSAEGGDVDLSDFTVPSFTLGVKQCFGLSGPYQSLATACAAGNYAVGAAMDALRAGRATMAVAGGVEPFSRLSMVGFSRSRAMAQDYCRPFDRKRSGMLLGEGAAMFVLELAGDALARGAVPLAEVVSLGLSCDAHHPTAPLPDGSGMASAMRAALDAAGVAPSAISWVNAHGTGTLASDAAEAQALRLLFGTGLPPVSGSKGALGHALGAASALELAICVQGLREQVVPPTWGHDEPDPNLGIACKRAPVATDIELVLNNAFAFGGLNSAVLLRRWAA
jgi:3-oxoacyl-[acyl-carrier-protein] synthase II